MIETNGTVICTLGTLASTAQATVTISVTLNGAGEITSTATVSGNEIDPDTTNNVATLSISVVRPVARPVGGYGEPQSARALLVPWIVLVAAGVALGTVVAVALRKSFGFHRWPPFRPASSPDCCGRGPDGP